MSAFFVPAVLEEFRFQRRLAERALAQIDETAFFAPPDPGSNSIAVIVKHVGGNLRSRWTDVLTTDGEKPDRNRDGEFVTGPGDTRAALMARWAEGWDIAETSLAGLTDDDLVREVRIRGERVPLPHAILRSLTHTASHVGQIVLLAKHLAGERWQTLSIPRGRSADYLRTPPGDA